VADAVQLTSELLNYLPQFHENSAEGSRSKHFHFEICLFVCFFFILCMDNMINFEVPSIFF
jgi:hypothetical protein